MSQHKVLTAPTVIKQGTGPKGPWTLYGITVEGHEGTVSGFTLVNVGDIVEIEAKQNGQYTNWNYSVPKGAAPATATTPTATTGTPSAIDSKRIEKNLKLTVLIAQQTGIDPSAIAEILEG